MGRILLQRLATGATGVKQARYRRGPTHGTRGSEVLYAHAQYNTQPVVGIWHLLFNAWCNEFRRGFCTLVLSFYIIMNSTEVQNPRRNSYTQAMDVGITSRIISCMDISVDSPSFQLYL